MGRRVGSRGDEPSAPRAAGGRGGHGAAYARVAMVLLLGGVLTPLAAAGLRSVLWVLVGVAGLALTAVGVWWALAHTGVARIVGTALSVAAPVTVLALYAATELLGPALLSFGLLVLAVVAARWALAPAPTTSEEAAAAPHHPWVLMNRRSGGGKVDRFRLVDRARAAGCRVHVLGPGQDVTALARQAVADGADLLGVAGGDGTQALVADVAAHHDVPFAVIPAGTRNHFALDLGLDRDDPVAALEALTGGREFRVDLGYAADRVFVNNASFGTYASVVHQPAYRDAKTRTAWKTLPGLLTGDDAPALRMTADGQRLAGIRALLVSNNPYGRAVDVSRPGRRERLDRGLLGVAGVRVGSTAEAARLASRPHSGGLVRLTADEVVVETGTATTPVGIDGEYVELPCPVVCRSAPGALRVRVPHHRPGRSRARGPAADWPRVARLALGRALPRQEERAPG
ncbi:diacylglycerol kinase family enzyme [Streptomyces capillispiralis]|uniref:Diacylglycerol kinase family enzyme n=2 Tax=Streptomyces capillispiralis TaxID=68182 RepID=A0A561TR67_9ACTN|nr:diacylglycerol kinase family enzyme [Streptomyces capillispiralis]